MAAYLGQTIRITRNDGYVPEMNEYKLNGKKQVEEWLSNIRSQLLGHPDKYGTTWCEPGDYMQRNDIWERDGSYWSVWDYRKYADVFEIIIIRAIKL